MKRLFGFGCSFTNYRWSTWFDCLAPEFDWSENWGQGGGGNTYIFNSLMEADQRYRFTEGDTVVVCWSNFIREDRYIDGRWHTPGHAMFATNVYNKEYIADHLDERGYLIRDMAHIKAVKTLLENRPGVKWEFLALSKPNVNVEPDSPYLDIFNLYQDVLDVVKPGYYQVLCDVIAGRQGDPHPTPEEHLAYLDQVLPGWVTRQETRVKMHKESINLTKDPKRSGMAKVTRL